jgi:hypothetical protein
MKGFRIILLLQTMPMMVIIGLILTTNIQTTTALFNTNSLINNIGTVTTTTIFSLSIFSSSMNHKKVAAAAATQQQDAIHELIVEHSLDEGKTWTKRGSVQYIVNIGEKKIAVKFNEPGYDLSIQDQQHIVNGGDSLFYLVRMLTVNSQGQTTPGEYLVASLRACALLDTDIEVLQLHCEKTGATILLQFQTPINGRGCSSSSRAVTNANKSKRITNKMITVLYKEAIAIPPTSYGPVRQLSGPDGIDGNADTQKQPESVLQRYWYIFLPMVIWTLFIQPMLFPNQSERTGGGGAEGGNTNNNNNEAVAAGGSSSSSAGASARGGARPGGSSSGTKGNKAS